MIAIATRVELAARLTLKTAAPTEIETLLSAPSVKTLPKTAQSHGVKLLPKRRCIRPYTLDEKPTARLSSDDSELLMLSMERKLSLFSEVKRAPDVTDGQAALTAPSVG